MDTTVTIDLRHVARGLKIPARQVQAVVELLDDGNTVPFITRYRKDQTGGLNEEQIREIQARLAKLRMLADRKQTILRSIESQGKLTEELAQQIQAAGSTKKLEDLYLPFKPRKQTLAMTARERGLEPLAREILDADQAAADLDKRAADFVDSDKGVPTIADALLGAGHILAEWISEKIELRQKLRDLIQRTGRLVSSNVEGIGVEPSPQAAKSDTEKAETAKEKSEQAKEDVKAAEPEIKKNVEEKPTETPQSDATETAESTPAAETPTEVKTEDPPAEVASEIAAIKDAETPAETETAIGEVAQVVEPKVEAIEPAAATEEKSETEAKPEAEPSTEAEPKKQDESTQAEAQAVTDTETTEETKVADPPESSETPKPAPHVPSVKSSKKAKPPKKDKRLTKKQKAEEGKIKAFRDYFEFSEEIRKIPAHRVLAINRGEKAKVLRVKLTYDESAMQKVVDELAVPADHPHAVYLRGCAHDALSRLILPGLERETRRDLTERSEAHAIDVFAKNLRNLLLQRPVPNRRVLAVDPGFRSGCKLAALDQFGNVLAHGVIYLVGRPGRKKHAKKKVLELIEKFSLTVIAVGNGTACREAEDFFADMISEDLKKDGVEFVIVNEAGASVYSTSRLARDEFPNYDASLRGAISIGRRLQDPLSELVKIDPANIGVGLYQHDVRAKHLRESLSDVIESCVNHVGVDLNTASPELLRQVSGLNQLTAQRVYEYRRQHGPYRNREQLKNVQGIGDTSYVQAAGFLKIARGDNPLDTTWIHPESYEATTKILERLEFAPSDLTDKAKVAGLSEKTRALDIKQLAEELGVGELTLRDILKQLSRPGRDPREDLPPPIFRKGVLKLEDLEVGMELTGTILNVVDFGAFVDIGMHDSGLVHVSRLADRYIRDAHEVVAVGDIVQVWVTEVDKDRRRVSLTMIKPGTERTRGGSRRGGRRTDQERGDAKPPAREGAREGQGRKDREAGGRRSGGDRSQRGGGGRPPRRGRAGGRQDRPQRRSGPYETRSKPKPIKPISEEMKQGKEAMRSFGDLAQFFTAKQQDGEDDQGNEKKKEK